MESHLDLIGRINRSIIEIVSPLLGDGPFAFLDFPDHANVGDSAIWLGSLSFFQKNGISPSYISKMTTLDPVRINDVDTIFLHGGGNFGDIWTEYWPNCHAFREAVLERFPNKRIVQLPQSIQFDSEKSADKTGRFIENHPNFTLLVRDRESFDFAQKKFQCQIALCPDMAFALGPLSRSRAATKRALFLLRSDKEKAVRDSPTLRLPPQSDVADWLAEPLWISWAALAGAVTVGWNELATARGGRHRLRSTYFNNLARLRLRRGLRLLSSYEFVVSDRLHVHILCTLLGIPHIVLDNSYGKNSRFMRTFSTQWAGVRVAHDLKEAIDALDSMLADRFSVFR